MAAYGRRDIRGGAVQTTITGGITNASTSCAIAASTGWPDGGPGEFLVVIDPGLSTEEKVLCSTRSTLTVNFTTRGVDGTTAIAHSSGAAIYPIHSARDDDEANLAVSKLIGAATAVGQIPVVDNTNSFAMVQAKTSGNILQGNGTTVVSNAVTGDVTISSSGVTAIGSSKVTSAMIVDGTIVAGDIANATITGAKMVNATVTETQLAASVAGAGIAGGAGTALSVGVDGSTVEINADAVRVKASGITANELATGAVTSAKILDGTIATADIAAGAITAALLAAGLPQGYVTGAIVTANQTGISTGPTDLTSLTITVTGDGVKRLRIFAKATFQSSGGGGGQAFMSLQESSTVLDTAYWPASGAVDEQTLVIDYDFVPSAASHTYKLTAGKNAFTMDLIAATTNRARIYAEWIG